MVRCAAGVRVIEALGDARGRRVLEELRLGHPVGEIPAACVDVDGTDDGGGTDLSRMNPR